MKPIDNSLGSDIFNDYNHNSKIWPKTLFTIDDIKNSWNRYVDIMNPILQNMKINNSTPQYIIVGDIHGSFLQFLTPLIKYKFISNVTLRKIPKTGNFDIGELMEFNIPYNDIDKIKLKTKIIYLGDMINHSIYGMDLLIVFVLKIIMFEFPNNIYWCIGNHDLALYFRLKGKNTEYTCNNCIITSSSAYAITHLFGFNDYKGKILNFFENERFINNILVYYYDSKIMCSHARLKYNYITKKIRTFKDLINEINIGKFKINNLIPMENFEYKSSVPYYYGHYNKLSYKLTHCRNKNDIEKILINALNEIKNGHEYCCDLAASTLSHIHGIALNYELISYIIIDNYGRTDYYYNIVNRSNIINKLNEKNVRLKGSCLL